MDSVYGFSDFVEVVDHFQRRGSNDNIGLIIKGGENKVSPKVYLRAYHNDDIETSLYLAAELVRNKEVQLVRGDDVLLSFVHKDIVPIEDHFGEDGIWLLDIFVSMIRGIMLKKLMPPSSDSGKRESGLAE
jgi:hypothetical protein